MMNHALKMERVFIFGICCSILGLDIGKILIHFQVIKGDILLSGLILFTLIWFIYFLIRAYRFSKRCPGYQYRFLKDKYCVTGYLLAVIFASFLKMFPE